MKIISHPVGTTVLVDKFILACLNLRDTTDHTSLLTSKEMQFAISYSMQVRNSEKRPLISSVLPLVGWGKTPAKALC